MSEEELPIWGIAIICIAIGVMIGYFIAANSDQTCTADMREAESIMMQMYNGENMGHQFIHRNQTLGTLTELYIHYNGSGASTVTFQALLDRVCVQGITKPIANWTEIEKALTGTNDTINYNDGEYEGFNFVDNPIVYRER